MKKKQLEQLVLDSKDDKQKLNDLVEAYKPFIASCAQKLSGKYLNYGSDDELSIAMVAFVQAVYGYRTENGEFLSYASVAIRNSIIDYYRKQKNHASKVVYINQNDDESIDTIERQASLTVYDEERTQQEKVLEIKQLKDELTAYDIDFFELESVSPKSFHTKKVCREVISYITNDPELLNETLLHKNLPLIQIEKGLRIKRKRFERHRKYIMTVLIILSGDYPCLKEYVNIK
ncbi:MAG: RNA polymerase sigma-I factor [Clostridiaceae bacterium]|jgi:RNA polymerase sigma factor|nr:RNA polymerase sigma-I factor [Clostridiaceae bacterium]